MPPDSLNDNTDADAVHGADAHGQAALLLIESLIHGLIARDIISVGDAVEIVDVATEVKIDTGCERGDSPANLGKALDLLSGIRASLAHDLADH